MHTAVSKKHPSGNARVRFARFNGGRRFFITFNPPAFIGIYYQKNQIIWQSFSESMEIKLSRMMLV